jgi:hypothetical protein
MIDSPDPTDGTEPPAEMTDEARFPGAMFFGAIGLLVVGGLLMVVYEVLMYTETAHKLGRTDMLRAQGYGEGWWWAGIACQLTAGWLFFGVASLARVIPTKQRSWFVLPGIVASYVLAAAIILFDAWAVAMILKLGEYFN